MENGRLVSYQSIVDKYYRDNSGLNYTMSNEEAMIWLFEFMAATNSPLVLTTKIEAIEIKDARGSLPSDLSLIVQAAFAYGSAEDINCGKAKLHPMRWATDKFHTNYHCSDADYKCPSSLTYQVNSNYIFTSQDKGYVILSYKALPTNDEGDPMIPADQQWIQGATSFIAHKVASILWQRDDLSDGKYFHYERERDWYFAQAVNYSKMPSLDRMEGFKNDRTSMISEINDHSTFFKNMQAPEIRHWRKNVDGS